MRRNAKRLFLASLLAVLIPAADLHAQSKSASSEKNFQKQIEEVEKNIQQDKARQKELEEKASALSDEISKLRKEMIEVAERTQDQEETITKLEGNLDDLEKQKNEAVQNLLKDDKNLSKLLGGLLRIKRQPPQAMVAIPQTPLETAQSIVLLKHMVPKLQEEADMLKQEVAKIAKVQEEITSKKSDVQRRSTALRRDKDTLEKLVKRRTAAKTDAEKEAEKTKARIDDMASKAQDLRDLLKKLQAERIAREAKRKAAKTFTPLKQAPLSSKVALPAKGKILVNYGQKNDLGIPSKGLTISARGGAQVITPYSGEVVFAGPFRGYGLILIIEHKPGYHMMLSRLGRIDVTLGQQLAAGEPVGVMPEGSKDADLYVEFRRDGDAVHPNDWNK